MPVRKMLSQSQDTYPTGSFCPIVGQYAENKLCLHDILEGKCLFETERNSYDDSDFYMTYWDEETNAPASMMFGTTRGWSYPCLGGSYPDATDEVKEKYQSWLQALKEKQAQDKRNHRARILKEIRVTEAKVCSEYNVSRKALIRLRKAFGGFMVVGRNYDNYTNIISFITNRRIRNKFKLNMKTQVIEWMKSDNPQYDKPLSPKQLRWL